MTFNEIYNKLQGDLQMDCEGPTQAPSNAGNGCYPTPPYENAKALRQAYDDCAKIAPVAQMKVGTGTDCTKAPAGPRRGYTEMAETQMDEASKRSDDAYVQELIRARKVGQHEGREDARRENVQQEMMLQSQVGALKAQLDIATKPVIYFSADPRVAELERTKVNVMPLLKELDGLRTKLTSTQYSLAALESMNANQAATIADLQERNAWQEKQLKTDAIYTLNQQERNERQAATIQKYREQVESLKQRLAMKPTFRIVRKTERLWSYDVLNIVGATPMTDGWHITVSG